MPRNEIFLFEPLLLVFWIVIGIHYFINVTIATPCVVNRVGPYENEKNTIFFLYCWLPIRTYHKNLAI